MTVTHLFFDLHGVLIDPQRTRHCFRTQLGRYLAERYGGAPEAWTRANQQIEDDWDSYYADLDFGGDDCAEQMWEGEFRTTRAHFRLTRTPEPPHDELIKLSREVLHIIPRRCDTAYPEARAVIDTLAQQGLTLSVTSHALEPQVRSTLDGSSLIQYFTGKIIGTDTMGRFLKDADYYRRAAALLHVDPVQCAVIDDRPEPIEGAKAAGMEAIFMCRPERCHDRRVVADALITDLSALVRRYPAHRP